MIITALFVILFTQNTYGAAPKPKIYIPVQHNVLTNEEGRPIYPNNQIPQGSQPDIDRFNKKTDSSLSTRDNKIPPVLVPHPYDNKTNSYWLNPDFQFGPGSVNDFGGNPNAEEILQPFVF